MAVKAIGVDLGNAVFSIAFCGLAVIGGRPTDELMVEAILDQPLERYPLDASLPPSLSRRSPDDTLEAIASRLSMALKKMPRVANKVGLEIVLVGWQRTRQSRWRPMVNSSVWSPRLGKMILIRHTQDPIFDRGQTGVAFLKQSARAISEDTISRMNDFFSSIQPTDLEIQFLVDEIRRIACQDPTVGDDVQVFVSGPAYRLEANAQGQRPERYAMKFWCDVDQQQNHYGLQFLPWMIRRDSFSAPSVVKGPAITAERMAEIRNSRPHMPSRRLTPDQAAGQRLVNEATFSHLPLERPTL